MYFNAHLSCFLSAGILLTAIVATDVPLNLPMTYAFRIVGYVGRDLPQLPFPAANGAKQYGKCIITL